MRRAVVVRPLVAAVLATGVGVVTAAAVHAAVRPEPDRSAGLDLSGAVAGLAGIAVGLAVWAIGMGVVARQVMPPGRRSSAAALATVGPVAIWILATRAPAFAPAGDGRLVWLVAPLVALLTPSAVFWLLARPGQGESSR